MRVLKHRRFSRRTLLRGLGGAAVALPWLEIMTAPRAKAAAPKRLLTWTYANGIIPSAYECQGTETNFTLSRTLAPLERHKKDLLVMHGISMSGNGNAHTDAAPHQLSGWRYVNGGVGGPYPPSATMDQEIAKVVGITTRLPSLEIGIRTETDNVSSVCFRGVNQRIIPIQDPYDLAASIFGVSAPANQPPQDPSRKKQLDKLVIDAVYANARLLSGQLGREDKARLDGHLQSVRDLEARLSATEAPGGMVSTSPLGRPNWLTGQKIDIKANDNKPAYLQMMMDIAVYALATDQTRVLTFHVSRGFGGEYSHTWVNAPGTWHELSHGAAAGNADNVEKMIRVTEWHHQQLANLVDQLKAVQEPGGTLLDNMVIFQSNEFGFDHIPQNMPYLLLGSCGGFFRTGRLLRFQTGDEQKLTGTWHNALLVSLMQAMGLPTTQFGDPKYGSGPLPGLR